MEFSISEVREYLLSELRKNNVLEDAIDNLTERSVEIANQIPKWAEVPEYIEQYEI